MSAKITSKTAKIIVASILISLSLVIALLYRNTSGLGQKGVDIVLDALPADFKEALKSMYANKKQMGTDNKMYKLDLATSILPEQGMCIYNLCCETKPKRTLEIGFAYGFSTVFFLAAIKTNGGGHHVAIDPFEQDCWNGIGLKKVKELRMDSFFTHLPQFDLFGIPDLVKEKHKYDIVFVDGDHRFDYILLDFTLSDYLLAEDGYIIFHDLWMPSTKKVIEFINNNRADYQAQENIDSPQMKIFKKIGNDTRPWDYYKSF